MRRGLITRPWLMAVGSLVVMAGLVLLLWTSSRPSPTANRGTGSPAALVLYCTSSLLRPVRDVCAQYEKEFGVKVRIDTDSSGALLSKLRLADDRVDLYISAEESFMQDARRQNLVAEVMPVARQHVVLGVLPGNPKKIAGFDDLLREDVRVVLPNSELTAAARAARRALSGAGRWEALLERRRDATAHVSFVGNVNEAAQAVKIGAADATVIWNSTAGLFALDPIEVPEFQTRTQERAMVGVTAATKNRDVALHFARYLVARDRGQLIVAKNFFQPIEDADVWADRPSPAQQKSNESGSQRTIDGDLP